MKKLVAESINETFAEATAGSQPEYSIFSFDWKADGEEIVESLQSALTPFGLFITEHPIGEGNDEYVFIISKGELSEEQVAEIADDSE